MPCIYLHMCAISACTMHVTAYPYISNAMLCICLTYTIHMSAYTMHVTAYDCLCLYFLHMSTNVYICLQMSANVCICCAYALHISCLFPLTQYIYLHVLYMACICLAHPSIFQRKFAYKSWITSSPDACIRVSIAFIPQSLQ